MTPAISPAFLPSHPLLPQCTPRRLRPRLRPRCCSRSSASASTEISSLPATASLSPHLAEFLSRVKEGSPLEGLLRADTAWSRLKTESSAAETKDAKQVIYVRSGEMAKHGIIGTESYDVCVCGGTLGIFLACALQMRGFKTVVVERGRLQGRKQEWNISRGELQTLIHGGMVTEDELESVIVSEWNPSRVGFRGEREKTREIWVQDVLNIGVAPDRLIEVVRRRFVENGGVVREFENFLKAQVFDDGVLLELQKADSEKTSGALGAGGGGTFYGQEEKSSLTFVRSRLLLDAMGSFSPIAKQMRKNAKPDGVCLTIGTCASGPWKQNATGDLIYSFRPADRERSVQYFWEAFPASENRRTTYIFTYVDCDSRRPSLVQVFEDYLNLLPEYQGVNIDDLEVSRALFGFFPCYRDSPIKPCYDRILQIGDAGGLQSPISFGGFGALMRHLNRLSGGVVDALADKSDSLLRSSRLREIQPYMPGLSATWLFQHAMSVEPESTYPNYFINDLLWNNMNTMRRLGKSVMRPFLQDVIQAGPLSKTLLAMTLSNPLFALKLIAFIGPWEILRWSPHFLSLVVFSYLSRIGALFEPVLVQTSFLNQSQKFSAQRTIEAWTYGSGRDHHELVISH